MRRKIMETTQTRPAMKKPYPQSRKEAMRNPWFVSLLGLVAVFLTVNIVFIVFAITSNPGLVADDYYEKGREYEKDIMARLAGRHNFTWETTTEIPKKITNNKPNVCLVRAVD